MIESHTYTNGQIWIRGTLYLAAAISTELLSVMTGGSIDPRVAGVKLVLTGVLTLRAYLDKTPSKGEGPSAPVQVTTPPNQPLQTTEVASKENNDNAN